jgi:hypothetical protein
VIGLKSSRRRAVKSLRLAIIASKNSKSANRCVPAPQVPRKSFPDFVLYDNQDPSSSSHRKWKRSTGARGCDDRENEARR